MRIGELAQGRPRSEEIVSCVELVLLRRDITPRCVTSAIEILGDAHLECVPNALDLCSIEVVTTSRVNVYELYQVIDAFNLPVI